METDLVLSKGARAIIVDTKFYADTLSEYRGRETIRPAHLFQLFSYLSNYGGLEGKGDPTEGVLLYPTVGANLDVRFEIEHRPVRVITVDLAEAWQDIDKRMRSITDENSRSANGPVH
jgi:5-methylcytosine-specific restriction enzyme subunit McrC